MHGAPPSEDTSSAARGLARGEDLQRMLDLQRILRLTAHPSTYSACLDLQRMLDLQSDFF